MVISDDLQWAPPKFKACLDEIKTAQPDLVNDLRYERLERLARKVGAAFEDKKAELGLLLTRKQNEPEDLPELYEQIRLKLNEMKASGMPLPADLVQFEQDLEAEFAAEKAYAERQTRMDKVIARRAKR